MLKLPLYGPDLLSLTTTLTSADCGIFNILGCGHRYDGHSLLSGIVCSVALSNSLLLANAPADKRGGLRRFSHFALSQARARGAVKASERLARPSRIIPRRSHSGNRTAHWVN